MLKPYLAKKLLGAILNIERVSSGIKKRATTDMYQGNEYTSTQKNNARRVLYGACGAFGVFLLFAALINLPGWRQQNVIFIAPAKGGWYVAQSLEKSEIISSAFFFRLAVFLNFNKPLQSGEYVINRNDSVSNIIDKMVRGRTARFRFTVPEGLTHYDISEALRMNTILKGEMGEMPDEGTLLPDTYFIRRGRARSQVVAQMHRFHNRVMKKLWKNRAENLPFKTIKDAVILASIVEKETGIKTERHEIAGVFINRLNKNHYMQLQSDPTVIYALSRGRPFNRSLTYADLRIDDPYNSYKHYGLPPGAIANPGRAALEAVLKPAKTKNFYFVADGTGGHVFAKTYQEHLENVKRWRILQESSVDDESSEVAGTEEEAVATN